MSGTLADLFPQKLPKLKEFLPEPPPKWPIPKILAHKWGLNPGRKATFWPQIENKERWNELVNEYGAWAARRSASFCPSGDWDTLESSASSLYGTVLARM